MSFVVSFSLAFRGFGFEGIRVGWLRLTADTTQLPGPTRFFDEGELSSTEIKDGLKGAFQQQTFIPVFAAASAVSTGVPQLLDFISEHAPSPFDAGKSEAIRSDDSKVEISIEDTSPVLSVFKTVSEAHVGELSFFRVFSGKIETGMDLQNTNRNQ